MDFYFVYSAGGGAGDWNGINRVFAEFMPEYFKNNILLKFGDIFFNHRSNDSIIKSRIWHQVSDARSWIINKTNDNTLRNSEGMIMDVGTTKIVSYITSQDEKIKARQLISRFNRILEQERILDKYCDIITQSSIQNAVTFDIPNLFKVRSQIGDVNRNLFNEEDCKTELLDACARYANYTYHHTGCNPDVLLTTINLAWSEGDLNYFFSKLDYQPTKIAVGGGAFYPTESMGEALKRLDAILHFADYKKVHFLGCGGLKKTSVIKNTLGNHNTFSVDNTTPFNRGIDGNTNGTKMSGYYDYLSGDMIRINPSTICNILDRHQKANMVSHFSVDEMKEILQSILSHQSHHSSPETYEGRAKLIIHNFDVFRHINK